MRELRLGIDIACRAAHQASLADETGTFLWSGKRFFTRTDDLETLWASLPQPCALTVVMEPTRNAWVPLAAWFRRRGAKVVMVPPEQSADLRDYFNKHSKSDRLDSRLLARLPLLHPEGLHAAEGLGPGDSLRRATKLRSNLVKRRAKILCRLDCQLELLGPAWHEALGQFKNVTVLRFLAAGYADPHALRRLGKARLSRFLQRHSRNSWGEERADELLRAAKESLLLWNGELDFTDLAEDIAIEARLALSLTDEIHELEERIKVMLRGADPAEILTSAPGVGAITAAQLLGRLGDPNRFRSLAGVRAYSGLVPRLNASGVLGQHGGPTKAGDASLREALFLAADAARKIDPTLAARYHRLMSEAGKHHNSALCHVSTVLLTRLVACWRRGSHYVIRDVDGRAIFPDEGRRIVSERYSVKAELRAKLRNQRTTAQWTDRRSKESTSAPSAGPSAIKAMADIS